jgi:prepilin-type N-terminal cleavage/methylation domain-containing protein
MNQRGVSLIELLITIIIAVIAFFPLAMPFIGERSIWGSGRRQTEAQRDAQVALRAMARKARESFEYFIDSPSNPAIVKFRTTAAACTVGFIGDSVTGQLLIVDECAVPPTSIALIDGNRSAVTDMLAEAVGANLVRVRLQVTHEDRRNEILDTTLFLRNVPPA